MGRIPIVFSKPRQINQTLWPFRAACHKAINFIIRSQTARTTTSTRNHVVEKISITVTFLALNYLFSIIKLAIALTNSSTTGRFGLV